MNEIANTNSSFPIDLEGKKVKKVVVKEGVSKSRKNGKVVETEYTEREISIEVV